MTDKLDERKTGRAPNGQFSPDSDVNVNEIKDETVRAGEVAALIERIDGIVKSNDCRDHHELVAALKDALDALARLSAPVPDKEK